jgi:hypothetical protein
MNRKSHNLSFYLLRILLMIGLVIFLAVPAGAEAPGDVISSKSDPEFKALQREWTSERMQNAKPYPLPTVEPSEASVFAAQEPTGEPGLIPGGPPGVEYSLREVMESKEIVPLGYPYPPPYTRYENFNAAEFPPYEGYKSYPYRTVGVLFFTQNGIDYRCSASSIGNYAIWTAGHCVSDGAGNWSTDFLFLPAYKDGAAAHPVAQWTGSIAWTLNGWHLNSDFCYDMGGVVLNTNSLGWKVSQLGWLGFAWNWPRDQHWHVIGYPAESPFDGNKMIICASSHSRDDHPCDLPETPDTIGTGCDQTGGSSGGPWIKDFSGNVGASNYLNGNVSYKYVIPSEPEQIFSPYFDDTAYNLWDVLVNDVP